MKTRIEKNQNIRDKKLTQRIWGINKKLVVLKLHNPFASRDDYGCLLRLVVNTYKGCMNRCMYCYTYSYTMIRDIREPKPKVAFREKLQKDIEKYSQSGLPKIPVYVSSSCEPFQPFLEYKYQHTLYSLELLKEAQFPLIIMTKNPGTLLKPEYFDAIDKSNTIVQVTVPFLDSRFEPVAPKPYDRISAIKKLTSSKVCVVARVDPIIPTYGNIHGQTQKEINTLIEKLYSVGVRYIISKCLRLAVGIKKVYPEFYDGLKPFYRQNRSSYSHEALNLETKHALLKPVYDACRKFDITLSTCTDPVRFPGTLECDGSEQILLHL